VLPAQRAKALLLPEEASDADEGKHADIDMLSAASAKRARCEASDAAMVLSSLSSRFSSLFTGMRPLMPATNMIPHASSCLG